MLPQQASRSLLLGLWLALVLLLSSQAASAQIVHEKPGQHKAATRRALRDAKRTDAPYKDSHLGVTAARLKRGQSDPPKLKPYDELDNEVDYEPEPVVQAKKSGFLGLRRNKKKAQPGKTTAVEKK
ncbi:hypothetical protein [Hymenobacter arizonensis]|uniref:Uncharacterized protein n=1 Tax=Hymenobacter arizonensis TaxID=1227077 RepID=A0A1I5WNA3_HYMAR|nr:hypothetical protein [Hymenobacter arizonensis]SFQ20998.1 hypothetical protein SAMN04515668_1397 [Hymenobacter arizonensis]